MSSDPSSLSSTTVEGRVLHIRSVSKKLLFVDIEIDGRVECVFKSSVCGDACMFRARKTSHKIHPGDVIKVQGSRTKENEVLVKDFTVLQRWSDHHSGVPFRPLPPAAPR